jgi:hypothetical protein
LIKRALPVSVPALFARRAQCEKAQHRPALAAIDHCLVFQGFDPCLHLHDIVAIRNPVNFQIPFKALQNQSAIENGFRSRNMADERRHA